MAEDESQLGAATVTAAAPVLLMERVFHNFIELAYQIAYRQAQYRRTGLLRLLRLDSHHSLVPR